MEATERVYAGGKDIERVEDGPDSADMEEDVIAVERFRNRSGWLCGVNGQLDPFRNESSQRGRFVYTCAYVRVHVHNMC